MNQNGMFSFAPAGGSLAGQPGALVSLQSWDTIDMFRWNDWMQSNQRFLREGRHFSSLRLCQGPNSYTGVTARKHLCLLTGPALHAQLQSDPIVLTVGPGFNLVGDAGSQSPGQLVPKGAHWVPLTQGHCNRLPLQLCSGH